jgi:hypothetical protein
MAAQAVIFAMMIPRLASVVMAQTVTKKEFAKYLARDLHCYHCGISDDTLVPQHRQNRGMGGSRMRSKPSNVVVVCSHSNGMFESSDRASKAAQRYGWKLRAGQDPLSSPVFDAFDGVWYLFDDDFNRIQVKAPG